MKSASVYDFAKRRRAELVVFAVVALALLLAVTWRPSPEHVALDARTTAVTTGTSTQFVFEESVALRPRGLVAGSATEIVLDGAAADQDTLLSRLAGDGPLRLTRLGIAPESRFRLSRSDSGCIILSMISGAARVEANVGDRAVGFNIAGSRGGQSDLDVCLAKPLRLAIFGIRNLAFEEVRNTNAGQRYAMSALVSVDLSFYDLGLKRDVPPLAGLHVTGLEASQPLVVEVPADGAPLRVLFAGAVEDVKTGPPSSRRSVMPLGLEHLLGTSPFAFALTGFSLIWGLIWSIVRFARPSPTA